jgi:hypothetical protein
MCASSPAINIRESCLPAPQNEHLISLLFLFIVIVVNQNYIIGFYKPIVGE